MAAVDDSVGPSRRTAEQVLVERAIKPSNKQEQAVFAWGQGEDGQLGYAPPPSVPHNRTSHVDQLNGQLGGSSASIPSQGWERPRGWRRSCAHLHGSRAPTTCAPPPLHPLHCRKQRAVVGFRCPHSWELASELNGW